MGPSTVEWVPGRGERFPGEGVNQWARDPHRMGLQCAQERPCFEGVTLVDLGLSPELALEKNAAVVDQGPSPYHRY